MTGGHLAYAMAVLLIGSLAMFIGQHRAEAARSYYRVDGHGHGHANATSTSNATAAPSLEESKLKLKFCLLRDCETKGEVLIIGKCICCLTLPDVPCWYSEEECHEACPVCDGDCPTYPPPAELHL